VGVLRSLLAGLRALFDRDGTDRDLSDEVDQFLRDAEADLILRGVPPAEAQRRVRLDYGDAVAASEDVRSSSWESYLQDLGADLGLAGHRLRRSPGFTVVVVSILALGIGSATAILSAAAPVLFEPLAYPNAHQLVSITDRGEGGVDVPLTFGSYLELTARTQSFQSTAAFRSWNPTLSGSSEPQRLAGQGVSAAYFDVLGVAPMIGPGFDRGEDLPGGEAQVLLGHALWERRFGGDPGVVGSTIRLDARPFTVMGVLPGSFEDALRQDAEVWSLLQYDPIPVDLNSREWGHHLGMVARLRPDIDLDRARADALDVSSSPVDEFVRPSWALMDRGIGMTPLRESVTARARPTMLVLVGAAGLLLAIVCLNLAVILMARGLRRRGELAVRAALGAGRGRLVRQLLTESLLLAGLGGVAALGVASFAVGFLVAISPTTLAGIGDVALDGRGVAFATGLTVVVGLLGGLGPALRRSATAGLREAGRSGSRRRLPRALVVAEVALAFVLMVGAGLLWRSIDRLYSVPSGFDAGSAMVLRVHASSIDGGDEPLHRFWARALDELRQVPGVRAADMTSQLPVSGDVDVYGVVDAESTRPPGADGPAYRYAVTPGYFETMGIELSSGRVLSEADRAPGERVVVVSASLAERVFPSGAVGRQLNVGASEAPFRVVGVVGNVKQESLTLQQTDAVYTTPEQWHWADRVRWFVIDAEDRAGVAQDLRDAIWSVNGDQAITSIQRMDALLRRSEARRWFVLNVVAVFAGLAAILAGLGLYGVLSGSVAERIREMGVRAALGATKQSLVGLVVRQGMRLSIVGIVLGVLAAVAGTRLLATLLYDVSRVDPLTYLGVAIVFAAMSLMACWLPARRVAGLDPLTTLNAE